MENDGYIYFCNWNDGSCASGKVIGVLSDNSCWVGECYIIIADGLSKERWKLYRADGTSDKNMATELSL
jgi:hypothetical protein